PHVSSRRRQRGGHDTCTSRVRSPPAVVAGGVPRCHSIRSPGGMPHRAGPRPGPRGGGGGGRPHDGCCLRGQPSGGGGPGGHRRFVLVAPETTGHTTTAVTQAQGAHTIPADERSRGQTSPLCCCRRSPAPCPVFYHSHRCSERWENNMEHGQVAPPLPVGP